jgi:hypothetical protein
MNIDISATYPIIHEDMYIDDYQWKDTRGNFHAGLWVYEQIRKAHTQGINEYLTIVTYDILDGTGTIKFHYQTVGNGFKLWHTFRIKDSKIKDQRNPTLEELRYLADEKLVLYTSSHR